MLSNINANIMFLRKCYAFFFFFSFYTTLAAIFLTLNSKLKGCFLFREKLKNTGI